jgi:hypothetical protein
MKRKFRITNVVGTGNAAILLAASDKETRSITLAPGETRTLTLNKWQEAAIRKSLLKLMGMGIVVQEEEVAK